MNRTKIKICGLFRPCDADYVNEALPDYAGFVFYEKSPRFVTREQAAALRRTINPFVASVGVFVNHDIRSIRALCESGIVGVIQLHGGEDSSYIAQLRRFLPDTPIWKAFPVRCAADLKNAASCSADLILLDSGGGSGRRFDWSLLDGGRPDLPTSPILCLNRPFILAGGLCADNIPAAIARFHPYAVDVSSGAETNHIKDKEKIRASVAAVRIQGLPQDVSAGGSKPTVPGIESFCRSESFDLSKEIHKEKGEPLMQKGRYGIHGGQYIPETLMNAVNELEEAYAFYQNDAFFQEELRNLLNRYAGRPSRLYYAERMTCGLGGAKIYLKREDLNHTGAHKINNVLGQVLLAKKMGKTRVIAETGAGQHGVAAATAAALMGLECEIFMGQEDMRRQSLNVYKMRLLGASVHPVTAGTATLKDAVSETMREWTSRIADTHYVLGSVMGPHPFPTMVRDFQAVISKEIREQILEAEGRLPDAVLACVGGGSNAIGAFYHFIGDAKVRLIGCEAAGCGVGTPETAATLTVGKLGIFHGMKSYFCQNDFGQIAPVYSISAGLDYPGVGPEHAWLRDIGRAEYVAVTDEEAVGAFEYLSRTEGIIPAIESAHAVACAMRIAPNMSKNQLLVVNLSGRGDKDCVAIARYRGEDISL